MYKVFDCVCAIALGVVGIIACGALTWFILQGFSTAEKVKDAQKQALEHTIKLNGCKLTGYYKRSSERMFVCEDGNTYREDLSNLLLVKAQ
jgi:hypothetical protein